MRRRPLMLQLGMMMTIILVVMGSIVLGLNFYTSYQAVASLTQSFVSEATEQSGHSIDHYLVRLKTTATTLVDSSSIRQYALEESPHAKDTALQLVRTVLDSNPDLVSAVIVTKDGRILSNESHFEMQMSDNMMEQDWYRRAINHPMVPVLSSARQQFVAMDISTWVVSVMQEITDNQGNNIGVLRLDINYGALTNMLRQLNEGENRTAFIVDAHQAIVYHPDEAVYQSSVLTEKWLSYVTHQGLIPNQREYVYQYEIQDTGWRVISVASLKELDGVFNQLAGQFMITGMVSLIIGLLLFYWQFNRWLQPLYRLRQAMSSQNMLEIRLSETGIPTEEFYLLTKEYNATLERIQQLMTEVQTNQQLAHQYELKALNSQINPHFLYNTLDTIIWMSEFGDNEKVIQLSKSLAAYFRLALNRGEDEIRLGDELEHVRHYLLIQQMRYGDQLMFKLEVPNHLADLILPKLVLQPLVENAIYHGLKPKSELGLVSVTVSENEQFVLIDVEDDGGNYQEKPPTPATKPRIGGVGMKNVKQRLSLYFGPQFDMVVDSEFDEYTRVRLQIPKSAIQR